MKQRDQTVLMKIIDYLDYEIVWNTSVSDVPQLYHGIEEMLKTEQSA